MTTTDNKIQIGDIKIIKYDNRYSLEHIDGEMMSVDPETFEDFIAEYFAVQFQIKTTMLKHNEVISFKFISDRMDRDGCKKCCFYTKRKEKFETGRNEWCSVKSDKTGLFECTSYTTTG